MKINKEMAEHLIRFHTEYENVRSNDRDKNQIFDLLKYLMDEIEILKNMIDANKPKTE
jgi:hypothetical protein